MMAKTEMTNDRAIFALKAVRLAWMPVVIVLYAIFSALGGFSYLAGLAVSGDYPVNVLANIAVVALILGVGLTGWMIDRMMQKQMGADGYRAWQKTPHIRAVNIATAIFVIAVVVMVNWR